MLEQLVESKGNGKETRRMGGFLLSTFTVVAIVTTFALIYSLFSYNIALASDGLDVSALVAPVAPINEEPKPEPIAQKMPNQKNTEKTVSDIPVRQANVQRLDESPKEAPKSISVAPNQQQARPNSPFRLGKDDLNPAPSASNLNGRDGNNQNGNSLLAATPPPTIEKEKTPAPPPLVIKETPKVEPKPEKPVTMVSGGVVNGKATNLVKPVYSAAARAIHAGGQVKVQVTIDENGNVIAANAISGHPLLLQASTSAAKSSKFSPTTLTGKKVKVTGVIIYNFTQG